MGMFGRISFLLFSLAAIATASSSNVVVADLSVTSSACNNATVTTGYMVIPDVDSCRYMGRAPSLSVSTCAETRQCTIDVLAGNNGIAYDTDILRCLYADESSGFGFIRSHYLSNKSVVIDMWMPATYAPCLGTPDHTVTFESVSGCAVINTFGVPCMSAEFPPYPVTQPEKSSASLTSWFGEELI
jgi:hypothetical protein